MSILDVDYLYNFNNLIFKEKYDQVIFMKLKTNNKVLGKIWDNLLDIFLDYKSYNSQVEYKLNKLGIDTVHDKGSHVKCFFNVNGQKCCITIATTPSDRYAGRQILRQFRRYYES